MEKTQKEYKGIVNIVSETELSSFSVIFEGSTMLEKEGTRGVSHLAEHLICSLYEDLQDGLDENSISWNAWTSSKNICFYLEGLDEYLTQFKDQMLNKIMTLDIKEERFLHEKKIVIQELMDCFNNQQGSHALNLSRKLFNDYDAIGLKEDLEELKYSDFMVFLKEQFSKPSLIVNVSKNTPYTNTEIEFNEKVFNNRIEYVKHPNNDNTFILNEFKNKLSLIFSSPIIEQEDFIKVKIINAILSSGLQSPLYQELREKKGLCYSVGCSLDAITHETGVNYIYSVSTPENKKDFISTVQNIFQHPEIFLTKKRFDIIKKSLIISKKRADINRYANINKFISPYLDTSYIIDDLKFEDLKETYIKYFDINKWYISTDDNEFI